MEEKKKNERKEVVAVKSKSATEIEHLSMKKKMERNKKENWRKRSKNGEEHPKNQLKINTNQHQREVIEEITQRGVYCSERKESSRQLMTK